MATRYLDVDHITWSEIQMSLWNIQSRTKTAKLKQSSTVPPFAITITASESVVLDGTVPFELPVGVEVLFEPF